MQEGKPSALTPQRVVELDAVGFIWMVRENKAEVWNRRLEELKLYRAQFGDCLVPQRYSPNREFFGVVI